MPVTIKVNGTANSLVHKGSNGISTATLPDVCKTPSPGGPVPLPYPNVSQSPTLAKGTTTVKADGGMMIAIEGSEFSLSNGDEPGVAGGVKSNTFIKESTWILYSFDVKIEGKGACRLTDKKFQNHENTVDVAGELQAPAPVPWWEAYLCAIFCDCLAQWKAQKNEVPMADVSMIEEPDFSQPPPPGRFERQGCVENELRRANHATLRPEQGYNMRTRPPSPVDGRGHKRPDVAVLAGPGPASGSNLTALVEMKFPGDSWQEGQERDYNRIAKQNNPDATVELLDEERCGCG